MSLKLIYFKMRALAEAPQLLLHYAGIDYQYLMSWEYFDQEWSDVKPNISFKQLPILMIDDEHEISQSIAILSYIEKLAGLSISNPIIAAKADAILLSAQELFAPLNPTVNFAVGSDFESKREKMMPFLLSRFEDLNRSLISSSGNFFIDDKPRACDFAAFHHLDLSKKIDPLLIKKFPRLEKFVNDISAIDSVNMYLSSRPELVKVGNEPRLIIDGVEHPTGIKKT